MQSQLAADVPSNSRQHEAGETLAQVRQEKRDRGRAEILQAELERLVAILAGDEHTCQIMVFGSMASGTPHEWSDLDVAVVMETALPFLERIRSIQRRVRLRVAMDLLVYTPDEWATLTQTRPFMREEIAAKGRVVYDRSSRTLVCERAAKSRRG